MDNNLQGTGQFCSCVEKKDRLLEYQVKCLKKNNNNKSRSFNTWRLTAIQKLISVWAVYLFQAWS